MLYNFIKRLFCKNETHCEHDWRCVEENIYGATFECSKCGKVETHGCVKKYF